MVKHDLWTAAYFGDIDRLKALLIVPDPPPIEIDPAADPTETAKAQLERDQAIQKNHETLVEKLHSTGVITIQTKGALPVSYGLGYRLHVVNSETNTLSYTFKLSKKAPLVSASV
eukprot:PhF_6_TR43497/c0_g1_i1/m.66771